METHFIFYEITTAAPFDQSVFVPMNLKMELLLLKPHCSVADKSKGAFNKNISPILQFPLIQILISCNNLIEAEDENQCEKIWWQITRISTLTGF